MQRLGRWTAIAAFISYQGLAVATTDYYGRGYTIISSADDDSDLNAVIYRQLPVTNIGDGLYALLDGTGWRLADSYAADPRLYRLYSQPLAENKQTIGPMRLDRALNWIAGDAWLLVVDPVNRLVSFEVDSHYTTIVKPLKPAQPAELLPSDFSPAPTALPVSSEQAMSPLSRDDSPAVLPSAIPVTNAASPEESLSHYRFENFLKKTMGGKE